MKKFFGILAIATVFAACGNTASETTTTDTTATTTDTTVVAPVVTDTTGAAAITGVDTANKAVVADTTKK